MLALALGALSVAARAGAAPASCTQTLGVPAAAGGPLKLLGTEPAVATLSLGPHHTYLIEVTERDNDALVEILDPRGRVLVEMDHPERRTGIRRAMIVSPGASLGVRVTGKEHAEAVGGASIRAFDLSGPAAPATCIEAFRALAQGDADYAEGEHLARGTPVSQSPDARAAFSRAAADYITAERALPGIADRSLRGQAALAVAAIEYSNLQDWAHAAEWAATAATAFGAEDPYRRSRAETLSATSWMEMGSPELLRRARELLETLGQFHLRRGERYDAALQFTNIAVVYTYEGRYPECITTAKTAARLFGSLHEAQRRAQAWQNQAVCLWGLGRLSDALRWFERARRAAGPDTVPGLYFALTNNTALLNYALGHFDEALSLFDRALAFAEQVHSPRDEAQSLYGIGVTYYAIGDVDRARQFLERALAIRTVALDSRGRMATLRSLANVDAEQGRVGQALTFDREALRLAVAPSAVARILIQTAVHTARAGRLEEARAQLSQVIADRKTDPLNVAEAQFQRAVVLRELGRPTQAQADLAAARPRLQARGGVTEVFDADLELARSLRLLGKPRDALAALDQALAQADAVREQTANPELRMRLGTPLRAAYELKIELLRARYETTLATGLTSEASALATAAFITADASRAHTLADFAAQNYPQAMRGTLAGEFDRRARLYRDLAERRFALEARLDRSSSEDPQARHLMADIAELEREADAVNLVIAHRALVGRGAQRPRSGHGALPSLAPNTALAAFWLGSESAYAWVVLPGSIQWTRLVSPASIEDAAARFHHSLTRLVDLPAERRLQDARTLYEMIIHPVEQLLAQAQLWVIVPDRALSYVPFAALRSASSGSDAFVGKKHDIAISPAVWFMTYRPKRPKRPQSDKLLLIDDPVYQPDDPRLRSLKKRGSSSIASEIAISDAPYHDLQRLPFTAEEARQIMAQFPGAQVEELSGLQATRERALSLDWSQYRYIHIAAHAVVDAQIPQLSAVVLGAYNAQGVAVEEAVRVSDLLLQRLNADVAVLSACDTALGSQIASEGTLGLESTLLARGARAVVASLWPVADETSASLMTDFYHHLLHDTTSAPAALGAAMRAAMSQPRTADPALWAAFQVSVTELRSGEQRDATQP